MQKHTWFEWIFLGLLITLAFTAESCDGGVPACPAGTNATYTSGSDEFSRLSDAVFYRGSANQSWSTVPSDSCWRPFPGDSQLATDDDGEAKLNLSSCTGLLYLFQNSQANYALQVQSCGKHEAQNLAGGVCVNNGTVLTQSCSSEFVTGSGWITKQNSVFSVTYLPEYDATIVVVLEGNVALQPVIQSDPLEFGEPIFIPSGQFTFTMPDDRYQEIEGLKPRQLYPYSELPRLQTVYPIRDWMIDIYNTAPELNVRPENWPQEFGGEAASIISLELLGKQVGNPDWETSVFSAADWKSIQEDFGPTWSYQIMIGQDWVSPLDTLAFTPDKTREFLIGQGYQDGFPLTILFPAGDAQLEAVANLLGKYFTDAGMKVEILPVPPAELDIVSQNKVAAGEDILVVRMR